MRVIFGYFQIHANYIRRYFRQFLISCIAFALTLVVYKLLWQTLYVTQGVNIAGLGVDGGVFYIVVVYALMNSFVASRINIVEEIKSGEIAYTLTRPQGYLLLKLCDFWVFGILRFLLFLSVGLLLAMGTLFKPVTPSLSTLWLLMTVVPLAILLSGSLLLFFISFSFWMKDSSALYWFYQKSLFFLGGFFFPLDFYPEALVRVINYFPHKYVLYTPAMLLQQGFRGIDVPLHDIGAIIVYQVSMATALISFSVLIFQLGFKKTELYGG